MSTEAVKLFDRFLAPGLSETSGKKAIADFFAVELPNIDDYSLSKLETFEKGDKTLVEWRNRYKDKRTGKVHQVYGVTIIATKNGLIQEMREYCNIPLA
jgi:ketosteroid isomerase-like protein